MTQSPIYFSQGLKPGTECIATGRFHADAKTVFPSYLGIFRIFSCGRSRKKISESAERRDDVVRKFPSARAIMAIV
jgi:hypothetical protein